MSLTDWLLAALTGSVAAFVYIVVRIARAASREDEQTDRDGKQLDDLLVAHIEDTASPEFIRAAMGLPRQRTAYRPIGEPLSQAATDAWIASLYPCGEIPCRLHDPATCAPDAPCCQRCPLGPPAGTN